MLPEGRHITPVHLSFKEVGSRVDSAERLERLADALIASQNDSPGQTMQSDESNQINVYYAFANATELKHFAIALQMLPRISDMQQLEEQITHLEKEKERVQAEYNRLADHVTKLESIKTYTTSRPRR